MMLNVERNRWALRLFYGAYLIAFLLPVQPGPADSGAAPFIPGFKAALFAVFCIMGQRLEEGAVTPTYDLRNTLFGLSCTALNALVLLTPILVKSGTRWRVPSVAFLVLGLWILSQIAARLSNFHPEGSGYHVWLLSTLFICIVLLTTPSREDGPRSCSTEGDPP